MSIEGFFGWQEATEIYHGRSRESNPNDVRTVASTQQLRLGWQVDALWHVDLTIPRVEIETEKDTPTGKSSTNVEGLGDIALVATLSLWSESNEPFLEGLRFLVGLEFPTGEEADAIDVTNPTPPSLLQAGSGTWDPIIGYRYSLRLDDVYLFHSTVGQITGGSSDIGFEPGSVLETRFGASTALWNRVTPALALHGEFRRPDEVLGNSLSFTGSSMWSVSPSVGLRIVEGLHATLSARIPIYYNVRGTQLVPGPFVSISLAYAF